MERLISNRMFRHINSSLVVLFFCFAISGTAQSAEKPIRVAIYDHSDGTAKGPKALSRVLGDKKFFQCKIVTPADVRGGALDSADVLIMPGGSGSKQAKMLEEEGREKIRTFVKQGGGYLGICAGSYLASSDYDWSLNLINAKVIDKAHWARGTGQVELTISAAGSELLKNKQPEVEVYYGQGPLLAPDDEADLPKFESLAEYKTEINKNNAAPAGIMVGKTAIARAPYGEGRVICFSPHCEVTGGPNYMTVNAVLWATKREHLNVPSGKATATTAKVVMEAEDD